MSFSAVADLLESKPRSAPAASGSVQVPRDVQLARDDARVKILQGELGRETDPRMRADIQTEINNTGGGTAYGKPRAAAPAEASPFSAIADALDSGGPVRAPIPAKPAGAPSRAGSALEAVAENFLIPTQVAANAVSGIGSAIMGGWRGLTALASGAGIDEAVRQVQAPDLAGGATARTYEPTTGAAKVGAEINALPGEAVAWVGKKAGEAVYEGSPVAGLVDPFGLAKGSPAVATAVETGVNAVPLMLIKRGATARAEPRTVGSGTIVPPEAAALERQTNMDIPTVLRRRQEQPVAAAPSPASAAPARQPLTLAPQEAAKPKGPSVFDRADATPQETATAAVAEAPKFQDAPVMAETGKTLPAAEQARRTAVLRSVGVRDLRNSAVKGDAAGATTDKALSGLEGDAGAILKTQLDAEREALRTHAEKIVADTGGTVGVDGNALYARGDTILRPLHELKNRYDADIKTLYGEADKRAPGVPIELRGASEILGRKSEFLGTVEGKQLLEGVQERMKDLGLVGAEGKPLAATVKQAEQLKQYLGDSWTPKTNRLIAKLKDGIDADVLSAAGEDIYGPARKLFAARKALFENDVLDKNGRTIPNGIAKLIDAESNKGISLRNGKSTEQIPDALARLPVDELAHVVQALKNVPPEIQPQAKAALAEIKAQFANRLMEAGDKRQVQWGAPDVTKYLNANSAKLRLLFDDAELQKIANLNEAGQMLRIDPYPGAGVQTHNLARSGVANAIQGGASALGTFLGATVGMPGVGAAVGGVAGRALAGKVEQGATVRAAEKRITRLKDFP